MHGDSRLVAMRHRSNHILWAKSRISSEEDSRMGRLEGDPVHHGHVPLVKLNAAVPFYPRKRVLLTNGNQYIICLNKDIRFAGWKKLAFAIFVIHGMYFFKLHPYQSPVFHFEAQGDVVVKNLDV